MMDVGKLIPPSQQILKDIYLSFFYRAKIGIIGLYGSSKSSLMKSIAGVDKDYQGEVVFLLSMWEHKPLQMPRGIVKFHWNHITLFINYFTVSEKVRIFAVDKSKVINEETAIFASKVLLREDYTVHRDLPGGGQTSFTVHAGQYKTRPNSVITRYGDHFDSTSAI